MSPQKPRDDSVLTTDAQQSLVAESQAAGKDGRAPDSGQEPAPSGKSEQSSAAGGKRKAPADYKWVGSQVRRMYDSVLNEPVPKSFTDLLKQAYDGKKTPEKS